ncbi:unnamed protein product [Camellia sinensis]
MILTPPYKHLIAQAHNGSGKTTCFVLGMLSRVDPKLTAPQALCICPTRELAIQNMEVLKKMGNYTGITSECAIPMDSSNYVPISKQALVIAQVVIGTPGTINKWVIAKKLSMNYLKILVFDEADHMLAEGSFFELLASAIDSSPSNACSEAAVSAIRPKTVRFKPMVNHPPKLSSQKVATGLNSDGKSTVVYKPLVKVQFLQNRNVVVVIHNERNLNVLCVCGWCKAFWSFTASCWPTVSG